MKNIRGPIRYPGGKFRLLKEIFSFAPSEYSEYREPFAGGLHALIHALKQNKDLVCKASDYFLPLANFYQQLITDPDKLMDLIIQYKNQYLTNERDLFLLCKERAQDLKTPALDRAAFFYILNRITFSGLTLSGGHSPNANRFKSTHIESARAVGSFLKNVEFLHADYSELLHQPSDGSVWIYCDPPYAIKSTTLYGKNGKLHSDFDHERFSEECKKCPHKLLITYDDNEYIEDLFSWANIKKIPVQYNMNNAKGGESKKKYELFITNY